MHSALGIDEQMCRRASDLAALGYVALATDMYGAGLLQTMEQAGRHFLKLSQNPDLLRSRVAAAFETARELQEVDDRRIAAIGFCFGGQCALELARSGPAASPGARFPGPPRPPTP